MHIARLGEVYFPFAAHPQISAEVDLSPDADAQFVTGANHHILRCRAMLNGAESCGPCGKESGSEDGKHPAGSGIDKALKLGERLGGHRTPAALIGDIQAIALGLLRVT
jgi:hypothetical protein